MIAWLKHEWSIAPTVLKGVRASRDTPASESTSQDDDSMTIVHVSLTRWDSMPIVQVELTIWW